MEICTINQLTCVWVFVFCLLLVFFFLNRIPAAVLCMWSAYLSPRRPLPLAPLPFQAVSTVLRSGPQPGHSELDLPPGVAHAGTVCPAAGGAVRAKQPQAVLRGRRCDAAVHGHPRGRERPWARLVRQHDWLLVGLLGQSLRTLGHWHLSGDTEENPGWTGGFWISTELQGCHQTHSSFWVRPDRSPSLLCLCFTEVQSVHSVGLLSGAQHRAPVTYIQIRVFLFIFFFIIG